MPCSLRVDRWPASNSRGLARGRHWAAELAGATAKVDDAGKAIRNGRDIVRKTVAFAGRFTGVARTAKHALGVFQAFAPRSAAGRPARAVASGQTRSAIAFEARQIAARKRAGAAAGRNALGCRYVADTARHDDGSRSNLTARSALGDGGAATCAARPSSQRRASSAGRVGGAAVVPNRHEGTGIPRATNQQSCHQDRSEKAHHSPTEKEWPAMRVCAPPWILSNRAQRGLAGAVMMIP